MLYIYVLIIYTFFIKIFSDGDVDDELFVSLNGIGVLASFLKPNNPLIYQFYSVFCLANFGLLLF